MKDRNANGNNPTLMMSLPAYTKLVDPFTSIGNMTWERVMIQLNNPSNATEVKIVTNALKSSFTP